VGPPPSAAAAGVGGATRSTEAALICGTDRAGMRKAGAIEMPTGIGFDVIIEAASADIAENERSRLCFVDDHAARARVRGGIDELREPRARPRPRPELRERRFVDGDDRGRGCGT